MLLQNSKQKAWRPSSIFFFFNLTKNMEKVAKILRRSIYGFSQNYHLLGLIATFLAFPVSAASLLLQSVNFAASSIFRTISHRLQLLFDAGGLPSSQFFSLLNFNLSLTIFLFVSTLPFTLSLLILAKVSIFRIIHGHHPRLRPSLQAFASLLHLYPSLLLAHLSGCLLILSANAAVVSVLFLSFTTVDILRLSSSASTLVLSAAGVVVYSLAIASATVISSAAVVVSYADDGGGCLAVLRALVLVRGKMATAITLALPANIGLAATEALFQYRVIRPYRRSGTIQWLALWEAFGITYMHSLLLVLDAIITCTFVMSCKRVHSSPPVEYGRPGRKDWEDEASVQV